MNGFTSCDQIPDAIEPDAVTELVRGSEARFIERITPLVRSQSVVLNLDRVQRIDAAGIAALISLYRCAAEAGHRFSVANPKPHVAEILALVGLDQVLLCRDVEESANRAAQVELTAA